VRAGETFLISHRGEEVAELRPVKPGRSAVVTKENLLAAINPAIRLDAAQFRADLDAAFD